MATDLSMEITKKNLVKFVLPTTAMMLILSLYTMVDGLFIARFVSADALAALNIVYPLLGVYTGVGIMLGTGGSAIIGRKLGEGKVKAAHSDFTQIMVAGGVLGMVFGFGTLAFLPQILPLMGVTERLAPHAVEYMQVMLPFTAAQMLQTMLSMLFVTAGKPKLGLGMTLASGVSNIVLDYIFIVPLQMGIAGAAWGTSLSYLIAPIFAVFYFFGEKAALQWRKFTPSVRLLWESMSNGASEMVSNLAASVIMWLMNLMMMYFAGEEGVAAVTVVLYTQFLFTALYLGIATGVAPLISYNYGSGDVVRLQKVVKLSAKSVLIASGVMTAAALLLARPLIALFMTGNAAVAEIAYQGYLLFSLNYIVAGVNIFVSGLFTALSNGRVSAFLSFLRTFVCTIGFILLLSWLMGINGVWLAVPIAELVTCGVAVYLVRRYNGQYHLYPTASRGALAGEDRPAQ